MRRAVLRPARWAVDEVVTNERAVPTGPPNHPFGPHGQLEQQSRLARVADVGERRRPSSRGLSHGSVATHATPAMNLRRVPSNAVEAPSGSGDAALHEGVFALKALSKEGRLVKSSSG